MQGRGYTAYADDAASRQMTRTENRGDPAELAAAIGSDPANPCEYPPLRGISDGRRSTVYISIQTRGPGFSVMRLPR